MKQLYIVQLKSEKFIEAENIMQALPNEIIAKCKWLITDASGGGITLKIMNRIMGRTSIIFGLTMQTK